MKRIYPFLLLILGFSFANSSFSQGYNFNLSLNQGNPGAINTASDTETVGWTPITTGLENSNRWSAVQALPFQFFFYGSQVTAFKASLNGQLTFTTSAGSPNSGPNTNLPTTLVPDKSILCFWDEFTSSGVQSDSSKIYIRVLGTAPNRQYWIKWTHYKLGNPTTTYADFAAVLEESSYKVYLIDMNNASNNVTATIGLQNNSTQAFQFGTNFFGFFSTNDGPAPSNNDYYEFTPQLTDDIGVLSIDAPNNRFGSGLVPVTVTLKNYSPVTVTSAIVRWTVNGVPQTPFNWTGSIPALSTQQVTIGNYNFVGGKNYQLVCQTDSPNARLDIDTTNDRSTKSLCPMMLGLYRIGPNGDFPTITAAINQLTCAGVEASVELRLMKGAGPFNESVEIGNIFGTSVLKKVTITADTAIEKVVSNQPYVFKLNGAKHFIFRGFIVENLNTSSFCAGIQFLNRADSNLIERMTFTGLASQITSSNGISLGASNSSFQSTANNGNGNRITKCSFIGMRYGINMVSASTSFDERTLVDSNYFENCDRGAICTQYQRGAKYYGNRFLLSPNSTFCQGIASTYDQDIQIVGNYFNVNGNESISLFNLTASSNQRCLIANNMMIKDNNQSFSDLFRASNSGGFDFINNSLSITGTSSSISSFFNCSSYTIENNSFAVYNPSGTVATLRGVNLSGTTTPTTFDYNNFYTNLPNYPMLRVGTVDYLLNNIIGTAGFNTHSYIGDPGYIDPVADLHVINGQLSNRGDSTVAIRFDYDGETRPFTPGTLFDIGADEFNQLTNDLGVFEITSPFFNGRKFTSDSLRSNQTVRVKVVNFGTASQVNVPIRFELNGVPSAIDTIRTTLLPGASTIFTFSSTANLSNAGRYSLKAYTLLANDNDRTNDTSLTATIIHAANLPITFPYFENFENTPVLNLDTIQYVIPGAEDFDYLRGGYQPRLRTQAGPGFAYSGTKAITLDRNSNFSTTTGINYLVLTKNLSNYDTTESIVLDFRFMQHAQETQPNNKIWIRGNDQAPWIQIADLYLLQGAAGQYRTITGIDITTPLKNAGQNFSSSFQIRFGQEGQWRAFNLQFTDGYTFDDIGLRRNLKRDLAAAELVNPKPYSCGDSAGVVQVKFKNMGILRQQNIPVKLILSGIVNRTLTDTIFGSINPGDSATLPLSAINTFSGGTLNYQLISLLSLDENTANDTLSGSIYINPIPSSPITQPVSGCFGEPARLTANSNAVTYNWFDAPTAGNLLATADTFYTSPLFANTTFYVSSVNSTRSSVGPTSNAIGLGGGIGNATFGVDMLFDVYRELVIDTVFVYASNAGNVTVNIRNQAGSLVFSKTVAINNPNQKTPIALGARLFAGSYRMNAAGSTVSTLFRNTSGTAYPYTIPNALQINPPTAGGASFYYFFYDWKVNVIDCESNRVPISVTVNPKPVISLGPDIDTCAQGFTALLSPGRFGIAYTYLWTPSGVTDTAIRVSTSGVYSVRVTNPITGCSSRDTINVSITSPPIPDLGPDTSICGTNYLLNPRVTGSGITYKWYPGGATTSTLNVTQSGVYRVEIRVNGKACFTTDSVVVSINPKPVVNLGPDQVVCGSALLNAGNSTLTKLWNTGDTSSQLTPTTSGIYGVVVTDPTSGCAASDSVSITVNQPYAFSLGADSTQCGGSILLNAQIPSTSASYRWSTGSVSSSINPTTSGLYSVVVIDSATTCRYVDTVSLVINAIPSVSLGADRAVCGNEVLMGGNTGMNYLWSDNSTASTLNVTTTGTYSVQVTDPSSGCSNSDTVNLTINSIPFVSLGNDTSVCGNHFDIDATAGTNRTFLWSRGDTTSRIRVHTSKLFWVKVTDPTTGCFSSDSINVIVDSLKLNFGQDTIACGLIPLDAGVRGSNYTFTWSPNQPNIARILATQIGMYSLTILNMVSGCSASDSIDIVIKNAPIVDLGVDTTLCGTNLNLFNLAANTNSVNVWNVSSSSADTVNVTNSGSYTLFVTDTLTGCEVGDTIAVTINAYPSFSLGLDTVVCGSGLISTSFNAADYAILWSNGDTSASTNITATSGYTATLTNRLTGCSTKDTIQVTVNPLPTVSLGNDTLVCGQTLLAQTLSDPDYSYLWNTGDTTASIQMLQTGTYSVVVTNSLTGCVNADTLNFQIDTVSVFAGIDTAYCVSGTLMAIPNRAGFTYNWSNGDTTQQIVVSNTGTFYVQVINPSTGCKAVDSVDVVINVLPTINLGNDTTLCATDLRLIAGPSAGYQYVWTGGSNDSSYLVTASGLYSVVKTNTSTGCRNSDTISILIDTVLVGITGNSAYCERGTLLASGNKAGFNLLWNTNDTSASINVTQSGNYFVVATNPTTGCSNVDTFTVIINRNPQISLGNDTVGCNSSVVVGGSLLTGMQYRWSSGDTTQVSTISSTGNYSVVVTNPITGCFSTDTIHVDIDTLSVSLGNALTVCDSVTLFPIIQKPTYAFAWTPSYPTLNRLVTASGSYILSLTSPHGCVVRDTQDVVVNATPIVNLGPDTLLCPTNLISLNAGNPGSTYTWNTGANTQVLVTGTSGIYAVNVQKNGCSATDTVLVYVSSGPAAWYNYTLQNLQLTCTASLNPMAVYRWDFGDGNTGSGQVVVHNYARSGNYQVRLIVDDHCGSDTLVRQVYIFAAGVPQVDITALKVYPNPTSDGFWIEYPDALGGMKSVTVYNALGQLVREVKVELPTSNVRVETADLAEGVYSIRVQTPHGVITNRVVVRR